MFLPGCAEGIGLPATLFSRLRRFWFVYKRNGRVRSLVWVCVSIFIPCTLLPGLRGGNRLAGGSLRTVAAILVHIQAERRGVDLVLVCVNNCIPCTFLLGCARGTGLPVAVYLRLR